jgi:hypothetical protein
MVRTLISIYLLENLKFEKLDYLEEGKKKISSTCESWYGVTMTKLVSLKFKQALLN